MECPVSINVEIVYELKHTAKNTILSFFFSLNIMGSWSVLFLDDVIVSEDACISNTNIIINVYTFMCTRYAPNCCMTYRWYLREACSIPLEGQISLLKLCKSFCAMCGLCT